MTEFDQSKYGDPSFVKGWTKEGAKKDALAAMTDEQIAAMHRDALTKLNGGDKSQANMLDALDDEIERRRNAAIFRREHDGG